MKNEVKGAMRRSYSTLTTLDRISMCVPDNPWSVTVFRDNNWISVEVTSFNGTKELFASKIGDDCYEVTFKNFARMMGKLKLTKTVEFTTTGSWVDQWIEMTQAHAPNPKGR
jgi:hypothetical protein